MEADSDRFSDKVLVAAATAAAARAAAHTWRDIVVRAILARCALRHKYRELATHFFAAALCARNIVGVLVTYQELNLALQSEQ